MTIQVSDTIQTNNEIHVKARDVIERILSMELVRVTERAAVSAARWRGHGNETAADQAAVDAMRRELNKLPIDGTVVIGEGERDEAPMLFIGEKIGNGSGPRVDIAVDPLEGTTLCAKDMPGAIAVMAMAQAGSLLYAPDVYMEKLAIGPGYAKDVVSLDMPPAERVKALAKAKGCATTDITCCILERPRHEAMIAEVRSTGASIRLITDGDVAGVIHCAEAAITGIDMYMAPDSWKPIYESLLREAKSGQIPMARIDEAVTRRIQESVASIIAPYVEATIGRVREEMRAQILAETEAKIDASNDAAEATVMRIGGLLGAAEVAELEQRRPLHQPAGQLGIGSGGGQAPQRGTREFRGLGIRAQCQQRFRRLRQRGGHPGVVRVELGKANDAVDHPALQLFRRFSRAGGCAQFAIGYDRRVGRFGRLRVEALVSDLRQLMAGVVQPGHQVEVDPRLPHTLAQRLCRTSRQPPLRPPGDRQNRRQGHQQSWR